MRRGAHGGPRGAPSIAARDDRTRGAQHRRLPPRLRAGPGVPPRPGAGVLGGRAPRQRRQGVRVRHRPRGRLGALHRQPAHPPRARHGRRQEHLQPAHRLARQRLPPLLGGRPGGRRWGRRGPHPAAAGARRRPRGEVQGQRRARVHRPAGGLRPRTGQPRRDRPGPDRPRRPLRRVLRQRPGRPRPPPGVRTGRARRGAVPGRGGDDPPPLGIPRRRAALRQVAAEPRSRRRRSDRCGADAPAHGRLRDAVAAGRQGRGPERPGPEGPHAAAPGDVRGRPRGGGDPDRALGADPCVPNRQGKTPLEVARKDCLFFKRGSG